MNKDQEQEQEHQGEANKLREKVSSNLVYVGIFSSIMLFAGLSSAVLVRKMDKFWVNIHLPDAFIISTLLIILSSITLFLALKSAKNNQQKRLKIFILTTFLLGIGFCISQFQGWKQYYSNGNAIKSFITYVYGQYGQSYRVCKNGAPIIYNGENYKINGAALNDKEKKELKDFAYQFCGDAHSSHQYANEITNYGTPYSIVSTKDSIQLDFKENHPYKSNKKLTFVERDELFKFAFGVYHDKPFFMLNGEYGKDFSVSLNGEDLDYDKKKLYFPKKLLTDKEKEAIDKLIVQGGIEYHIKNGKIYCLEKELIDKKFDAYMMLNNGIEITINQGEWIQLRQELNSTQYGEFFQTTNVSSSFVWVLTGIHFLHILFGLIMLLILIFRAFAGKYTEENQVGLKAVGIFWHFIGVLWIYLYVFLEFIN